MDRRKKLATAGAVSLTATAAVIAVASSVGIFGLGDEEPRVGKLTPIDSTQTTTATTPDDVQTIVIDDTAPATAQPGAPGAPSAPSAPGAPGATVGTTPQTAPGVTPGTAPTTSVTTPHGDDDDHAEDADDDSSHDDDGDDRSGRDHDEDD